MQVILFFEITAFSLARLNDILQLALGDSFLFCCAGASETAKDVTCFIDSALLDKPTRALNQTD
jgi:hypothetical protein